MNINYFKPVFFLIFCIGIFSVSCEKKKIDPIAKSGPPAAFCTDCHKATFPEFSTDAHQKHTEGLYSFACSTCHFGHGEGTATHQNSEKDISFDPNGRATRNGKDSNSPEYNPETKVCSNVYCHSNGVSADRGSGSIYNEATDQTTTYTWKQTPFDSVKYRTTPSWADGKIVVCASCHNGTGNMESPYFVSRENSSDTSATNYPATGSHQIEAHRTNTDFSGSPFSSPYWGAVQCFWCHNTEGSASIDGPIRQGTYGSSFHIDGETYFNPLDVVNGGTMANGLSNSFYGGHCGFPGSGGRRCW